MTKEYKKQIIEYIYVYLTVYKMRHVKKKKRKKR